MKILIIGAAGMVGRKLAERLARDGSLGGAPIEAMTLVDVVTPEAPAGFTSAWSHWQYINEAQQLPNAARVLAGLCDLRLPLTLGRGDCIAIAGVLRRAMADTVSTGPSSSTAV